MPKKSLSVSSFLSAFHLPEWGKYKQHRFTSLPTWTTCIRPYNGRWRGATWGGWDSGARGAIMLALVNWNSLSAGLETCEPMGSQNNLTKCCWCTSCSLSGAYARWKPTLSFPWPACICICVCICACASHLSEFYFKPLLQLWQQYYQAGISWIPFSNIDTRCFTSHNQSWSLFITTLIKTSSPTD